VKPGDVQLIEHIQRATQGGARLLRTLARRGKAIERDEASRAAFLLTALRNHPFYKAGRLAFDMLEIEDLMLDGSPGEPMSTQEVFEVLNAGARRVVEVLVRMGSRSHDSRATSEPLVGEAAGFSNSRDVPKDRADELVTETLLPRVTFGPVYEAPPTQPTRERPDAVLAAPELQSSDYLYDYVVLGLLDVLGGVRLSPF
jgi:hypothetical protein